MIKKLYQRFYPSNQELFDQYFGPSSLENIISMAALQGIFLQNKEDPAASLQTLKTMVENPQPQTPLNNAIE